MKNDYAFSGLEAAIVLIAFVVVAAVFSYVMLGAGFFATQKSQEVTYSGIKQSTSNLVIDGTQYGQMGSAAAGSKNLWKVTFYLTIPQGGQPQNMDDISYTVTVNDVRIYETTDPGTGQDGRFKVSKTSGANILKPGDTATMVLQFGLDTGDSKTGPTAGKSFTLEVRPKVGASSLLSKQLVTGYKGGPII